MRSDAPDRSGWPPLHDGLTRHDAWNGSYVSISTSRWVRDEHPADRSGSAVFATFVLMQRGSYVKSVGDGLGVGDPNHVMYYNPSDEYRISHPRGDLTLGAAFRIRPELLDRLISEIRPDRRRGAANPFPVLSQSISATAFTLHHCILAHLAEPGPKDAVFVEETLAMLTRDMVVSAYRTEPRNPRA